jgi:hypothetical protein
MRKTILVIVATALCAGGCSGAQLYRASGVMLGAAVITAGAMLTDKVPPTDVSQGCDCPGMIYWAGPALLVTGGAIAIGALASDPKAEHAKADQAKAEAALEAAERSERERAKQAARIERDVAAAEKKALEASAVATFHAAQTALAGGDCNRAAALADDIRLDAPGFLADTVESDPALLRCIDRRNAVELGPDVETAPLPQLPTDDQTLRFAQQLRSAAADHDCRTVDTLLVMIWKRDRPYHDALAAGPAVGECE